ncbi:MAG: GDP-mannose 4,6-dehydratase [Acidobacteria bacterium]|nr:GDP-mannose 4,6-dehydratase [Acidobacteriota bacterium]
MFLITGGAGFIGSHLIDRLAARGEGCVCLDDFNDFYDPAIKRRNTAGYERVIEGDIRNQQLLEEIFTRYPIRKIVHLAARAGVRPSLDRPLLYEDVNVRGTLYLLEMAKRYKVEQFVFASSSSVYGGNTKIPFSEEDNISRTVSPYAATKYAGELMCYTYHHLYGIPTTCLRFFTVYGPRQRPEMAIHKFARLIYEGKPIPFFGDGETARDYTYIDDIMQGVLAAIDRPFPFEVFNLGESFCVKLSELVALMEEISRRKAELQRLPNQPGDVEITYADISKARRVLGYNPQTPIRSGLEKFIAWFESNQFA